MYIGFNPPYQKKIYIFIISTIYYINDIKGVCNCDAIKYEEHLNTKFFLCQVRYTYFVTHSLKVYTVIYGRYTKNWLGN